MQKKPNYPFGEGVYAVMAQYRDWETRSEERRVGKEC